MQNTQAINVTAGNATATGSVTVSDNMPGVPCPDPAGYKYVGARYVPLFAEPAEWNINSTYEPLTIVLNEGNSYTSKQYVPVGIQIDNEEYWALTGNYNAQVEQYRQEVQQLESNVENLQTKLSYYSAYVTPMMYGAAGDGVTNDTVAFAAALENEDRLPVYIGKSYAVENLVIPQGSVIFGDGKIVQFSADYPGINTTNSDIELSGIEFVSTEVTYATRTSASFVFRGDNTQINNFKISGKSDRCVLLYTSSNSKVSNFKSDGYSGTTVTITNCNNTVVENGVVHAAEGMSAHNVDAYATGSTVCDGIVIRNIIVYNGGSSTVQITAEQSGGANFTNYRLSNIYSIGGVQGCKIDGVVDARFYHCFTANTKYGLSVGGQSSVNPVNLYVDGCSFANIDNYIAVYSTTVENASYNNCSVFNCASVNNTVTNSLIFTNNVITSNDIFIYGSTTAQPKYCHIDNNVHYTNNVRFPTRSDNTTISNNILYAPTLNTGTRVAIGVKNYAKFVNNTFIVDSLPLTFSINRPGYAEETDMQTVFHYGNTVNASNMTLNKTANVQTEYTYTVANNA